MKSLVGAMVWKELHEIRRDPVTVGVAVFLPLLMLYLFGSALSLDVNDAAFAVYDLDRSPESRELATAFANSGYFKRIRDVQSESDIRELLDRGRATLVLVIPPDFSGKLARHETAGVQTIVDGSFSATAMVVAGYAEAIVQNVALNNLRDRARAAGHGTSATGSIEVRSRVWFNAPLESANYIVPGLFGVILMAFPPLLTALAVVREKEAGSVQQIFVSPMRPYQFIAGKLIPYAFIALVEMFMILAAGRWWFHIPFLGSFPLFMAAALIYVLCTVGLGLLVSSVTRSQLVAMLLAFVVTLMPSFLFSGFLFPIFTMPLAFQVYTQFFPARYFIEISRGVVMKGAGIHELWPEFLVLAVYTVAVFTITTLLFRKKVA